MSHAYRSAYQHIVGTRLAEMKQVRDTVQPLLGNLGSVESARIARAAAGVVGLGAALAVAVCAAVSETAAATTFLVGGAAAMPVSYVLARLLLGILARASRPTTWSKPHLTGELDADLARIDASSPLPALARRLGNLEAWSSALPLAAISLLAPLTLHFLVCCIPGSGVSMREFGTWIQISLVVVGHAHLALMAFAIAFSRKMARLETEEIAQMSIHREWAKVLGLTVAVSAVPGVLLLAVPPVISAVTGLAFIPFMFVLMRRRVLEERATMHMVETAHMVRVETDVARAFDAFEELADLDPAAARAAV
jgi:hypothetical protein